MKNLLLQSLVILALLSSCASEDPAPQQAVPLSAGEKSLTVALYGLPDVMIEQHGQQAPLAYNRQVFIDLDMVTDENNADTIGNHVNDDNYVAFDLWVDGADQTTKAGEKWDLVLSRFNGKTLDHSTGEEVAYQLVGGLINKEKVTAIKLNKTAIEANKGTYISYQNITYADVQKLTLTEKVDEIGADWKQYNFTERAYTITADQYYIIKTTEGVYFKLIFTNFYRDADGKIGFPTFKFARILEEV